MATEGNTMRVWKCRPLWTPEYGTVDIVGYYTASEWVSRFTLISGEGGALVDLLNDCENIDYEG